MKRLNPNAPAVPLDTVILRVTRGWQLELERIGNIPAVLRPEKAFHRISPASFHLMTIAEAMAIQADTSARAPHAVGGLKISYTAALSDLRRGVDEARERQRNTAAGRLLREHRDEWGYEAWVGTLEQLRDRLGVLKFPGQPGCPAKWIHTADSRGFMATVTRWQWASVWPEFYEIGIRPVNAAEKAAEKAEDRQRWRANAPARAASAIAEQERTHAASSLFARLGVRELRSRW
jgi:hypothetical protein